jgi:hypothetical protein
VSRTQGVLRNAPDENEDNVCYKKNNIHQVFILTYVDETLGEVQPISHQSVKGAYIQNLMNYGSMLS